MSEDIVIPQDDKTVVIEDKPTNSNDGEPMLPKSRYDQVAAQRDEERRKNALLEEKINLLSTKTNDTDPDLDKAADALLPILVQKGFITKQQKEEDDNARVYANQLKELSTKYDGNDGRPVFDPYEISEYAKETKVFDLETAYEKKYKKELFDYEVKKLNGEEITTEKPGEKVFNDGGNVNVLTREAIAKKLAAPGGDAWYEKNRDALLKAMEKGEIR